MLPKADDSGRFILRSRFKLKSDPNCSASPKGLAAVLTSENKRTQNNPCILTWNYDAGPEPGALVPGPPRAEPTVVRSLLPHTQLTRTAP